MQSWICGFLLILATTVRAEPLEPLASVRDGLNRAIERSEVRAAVIGLYADGQTRVVGLGRVSRDDGRAPGADTVFEIGSISKVFTALLAQVQVDGDRLDWEDPITKHLGGIEFASEAVAAITLRELATHTSGLPRLPDNMTSPDALDPYAGYGRAHLEAFLSRYQPAELVKESAYSNLGAGLLGVIAADAAGLDYGDAMRRDVLMPLGMNDSAAGLPGRLKQRLAPGFSQGADMPNWDGFDALAGAGALVSTAGDLLRFCHHNLSVDPLEGALEAIRQPEGNSGLGWQIQGGKGDPIYWHNGGTGGYASFLAIRPKTQTAVVILTTSTAYNEVTELGFAQITGKAPAAGAGNLDPYVGAYQLGEGFVLSVFAEDGRLFGQATGQGAFPLTPDGEHVFVFPAADIRITFEGLESGTAARLTMVQAGRVTEAPRVAGEQGPRRREIIDLPASALADFESRYLLAPGVVITVEARDGQLYAQLTGQAAFPVFPFEADAFFYKVVDAQLYFERDNGGRVTAVVLHQMGQQRAPRIE